MTWCFPRIYSLFDWLQRLRQKVEQLQTENAELEIKRDNLTMDLEDVSEK